MQTYLPSIPYPSEADGFWSPVTSTINWCEEDYYATTYCAEIVNSLTNLVFVYLAYRGISSCIRNNHDTVFLIGFISYLVIGLGSFAFHTSLKYETQLLDELAMIYTTSIMLYAIFSHRRSPLVRILTGLFVVSLAVFITLYYHYLKNPAFHQNAFALLTLVVFIRSMWAMNSALKPSWRAGKAIPRTRNGEAEQARLDRRDSAILRTMWTMHYVGLGSVALGFLIWNIDNEFCSVFRGWRREVGLPWGILLEGHGWWHLFTGIAQYFNLTWSVWLRYCVDGEQDKVDLVWPSLWTSVPSVERRREGYGKGEKSI